MTSGAAEQDEVGALLDRLDGLPVAEHVGVYAEVHERLQRALAGIDQA
ncbi:hypothetical protein BH20ACT5_BH20ACT5_20860 [soil metagenome]